MIIKKVPGFLKKVNTDSNEKMVPGLKTSAAPVPFCIL
jgi:hypothetical protein